MNLPQIKAGVKEILRNITQGFPHMQRPDLTLVSGPSYDACLGCEVVYQWPARYYEGWAEHVGRFYFSEDPMTVVETEQWLKNLLDRHEEWPTIIVERKAEKRKVVMDHAQLMRVRYSKEQCDNEYPPKHAMS
jgi:hypothetical protein